MTSTAILILSRRNSPTRSSLPFRQYLDVLKSYDAGLPVYVFLSLCNASQCYYRHSLERIAWVDDGPLGRELVALPEIYVDSFDTDVPAVLRPAFNMLWNIRIPAMRYVRRSRALVGQHLNFRKIERPRTGATAPGALSAGYSGRLSYSAWFVGPLDATRRHISDCPAFGAEHMDVLPKLVCVVGARGGIGIDVAFPIEHDICGCPPT